VEDSGAESTVDAAGRLTVNIAYSLASRLGQTCGSDSRELLDEGPLHGNSLCGRKVLLTLSVTLAISEGLGILPRSRLDV
jgi:hypothetical protein